MFNSEWVVALVFLALLALGLMFPRRVDHRRNRQTKKSG